MKRLRLLVGVKVVAFGMWIIGGRKWEMSHYEPDGTKTFGTKGGRRDGNGR